MGKNHTGVAILSLGSIPFITTLGNSTLIPILPEMKEALNLNNIQVSLTITLFSIAAAICIPAAGYLSDRFSRKAIIVPSLVIFGAGGLLAGIGAAFFSNAFIWLLIGRIIQGIGAAGTFPIAMALIGDLFKGSEQSKMLGIYEASNELGKVLSPIIGAAFALITWYFVFFTFPVISFLCAILVFFLIKERRNRQTPPPFNQYVKGLFLVFKQEGRWLFTVYLAGGTCLLTIFGILFYLSDKLETEDHITGVWKGLILAIPLLVLVTTSYRTGSIIGKNFVKMKRLAVVGFILMTASYLSLVWIEPLIWFIFALCFSSIGAGLVLPCVNTMIAGAVGKEKRGFITSLYGSVRYIGVALGPLLFGWLMDWSRTGLFLSVACFTFLVAMLVLLLLHVNGMDGRDKRTKITYNYY
ncbi:MFS transporter [Oceanobacillus kimchii]|uniref:MFS transporter n=1 Tax=Oceanobacillus kimchii TaxID=746691 RepID=UPI0021A679A1|nr:MFS transporter [Oceanobacillus kimchii]MCT1576121.1 MFS transporter [Oceanobacillus kimchii]MCT2135758.1 MFS transporter [Oceanobacillus kimchii]